MTYAIVEAGGKQFWIEPGKFYDVNYIDADPGDKVLLNQVLLIKHRDTLNLGHPWVTEAKIQATVLQHLKAPKINVYKMQPKKRYQNKKGHRQHLTRLFINSVDVNI
uniref:Large ribosomal subunit protein bL21m n=1 Tax=Gronococcus sybilensis TaxID=3028029 RepID=A0A9Y1MWX4_9RHOD|nr:ribosomal protein L21 [Gronococcus sybilensis]